MFAVRGIVQCGQWGSSGVDIRIFGAKNIGFSKLMVWPHERGEGELNQGEILRTSVNFSRFCSDVLYGRPLIQI